MRLLLRNIAIVAHDLAAAALAWMLAYWLRFNFDIPDYYLNGMLNNLAWVVPLHAGVFVALAVHRGMWRYVSVKDLLRIVMAVALVAALVGAGVFMLQLGDVPRCVYCQAKGN